MMGVFININKSRILHTFNIFINMKQPKKYEEKKVKISITLSPEINNRMKKELTNKSRLIEKLLTEYYEKKMG